MNDTPANKVKMLYSQAINKHYHYVHYGAKPTLVPYSRLCFSLLDVCLVGLFDLEWFPDTLALNDLNSARYPLLLW